MSTIGYVDVEFADNYVATHFVSTDALRENWESLDEEDKEVLLRKSFESIESLPFTGHKLSKDQPMSFPRCPWGCTPEAVLKAQVENAVSLADSDSTEDAAFYEKLWQFGVESYSIGNLSESVSSGAWSSGSMVAHGLTSSKAQTLLKPFLQGGYSIRRAP